MSAERWNVTDDVDVLRELCGSVYLTPTQRAALGRLLGSAAHRGSESRSPLPSPERRAAASRHPAPLLSEAEKERERIELLGPIGGGQ